LAKAERLRQSKLADVGQEDLLKTINSNGNVQKSMTAPSPMSQKGNLSLLSRVVVIEGDIHFSVERPTRWLEARRVQAISERICWMRAGVQGVAVMATPLLKRDGARLATLALQTGIPSGVNGRDGAGRLSTRQAGPKLPAIL
jgi:hypothetical protein